MTTLSTPSPYPFTFDPATTALVVIDMQRDFLEPGGFGETLGNDVSQLQPRHRRRCGGAGRRAARPGCRHPHPRGPPARPVRLPAGQAQPRRSRRMRIGDPGPNGRILIRGEYGHDIIDELAPDRPASWSSTSPARARSTPPSCGELLDERRHHAAWSSPA